jgi:hypothetical protein
MTTTLLIVVLVVLALTLKHLLLIMANVSTLAPRLQALQGKVNTISVDVQRLKDQLANCGEISAESEALISPIFLAELISKYMSIREADLTRRNAELQEALELAKEDIEWACGQLDISPNDNCAWRTIKKVIACKAQDQEDLP